MDAYDYYNEKGDKVAFIDRTYADAVKVVLVDKKDTYIQKFWIEGTDKELVERCDKMRELGIGQF